MHRHDTPRGDDGVAGSAALDTDPELLRRIALGELAAFEVLFDRHRSITYSIALRILRDGGLAEDAVQETFLAVWRYAERYAEDRAPVRTWLLAIVRHRAIDMVRRRKVTVALPDRDDQLGPTLHAPDVWREVASGIDADAVRRAVASLTDVQRQAVELGFFRGLTHREIARRTALPLGTVKGRMRSALLALRRALGDATHVIEAQVAHASPGGGFDQPTASAANDARSR